MKVICDRGGLVESLNLVSGVVVARTPKPVLRCVKLKAQEGLMVLAATDLEVSVAVTTPRVEVTEAGETLVPCDKLLQIVRESVDPTLDLQVEQDVAHIRGPDSHFEIYGQPAADFPPEPQFTGEPDFQIQAGLFARLISQTAFAAARETSRYAMNGVLIDREGKTLTVVATDGRRLALARGDCDAGSDSARQSAIVPTKALNLLQRLCTDEEQLVKVRIAENQIVFATEQMVLASNLVEGNFPPYEDVIPKDGDRKATIGTEVFGRAVRRAALLTDEESKGVRIAFSSEGVKLTSRAPDVGHAEIEAPVVGFEGEPMEIGFNPQFILDALKVVDVEQVVLALKAPNKPGLLKGGPDFFYVIMPVNLT